MKVFSSDLYDDRSQGGCSTPCTLMYFSITSLDVWHHPGSNDSITVTLNFDSSVKVEKTQAVDT